MHEAPPLPPEDMLALYRRLTEDDQEAIASMAQHRARKADPVGWSLDHAPEDDEPLTAEEVAAIEEARAEPGTIPWEQVKAELGL